MNLLEKVKFVRILTPKVLIRKIFFKLIRLFRNRFELIKIQFKPTYIVKQNKKPDFLPFVQTIEELFESLKFDDYLENNRTLIFELADNYLNHKFNLLGSGWTKVSHHEEYNGFSGIKYLNIIHIDKNKFSEVFIKKANRNYSRLIFSEIPENYVLIDWQRDFRSGYRWSELEPSKLIRYGNLKGVDIKNPWEIGRMQHLILFFYSWKMSNNNLYADEFQNQILDFIASNPPYMGVQWQNAMEPSIRVSNWILVFCLFYANGYQFDDKFIKILIISINDHISFIENNLEWSGGLRGNHYFSNLSGLIIAKLFLGYEKNLQNLELLINSILEEIDYQFMNDGGNFEKSLPYHYFVTEMMLVTLMILSNYTKKNSNPLLMKINLIKIIKFDRIIDFTIKNLKKNNSIDIHGDSDSGYFFRFSPPYQYSNNSIEFNLNDYSEILKIIYLMKPEQKLSKENILKFEDFGIYLLRHEHIRISFSSSGFNKLSKGGHQHNDNLSFLLNVNGKDFFVDSGTYNYTAFPDLRNDFRSVKSHNTLQLSNLEQNKFIGGGGEFLFWLIENGKSELILLEHNKIIAKHDFFGVDYVRTIELISDEIIILEQLKSEKEKYIRIILDSKVEVSCINIHTLMLKNEDISIYIEFKNESPKVVKTKISPYYGELVETNLILVKSNKQIIEWKVKIKK